VAAHLEFVRIAYTFIPKHSLFNGSFYDQPVGVFLFLPTDVAKTPSDVKIQMH
jgi:hypothetical protein